MTARVPYELIIELVRGDREIVTLLIEEGVIAADPAGFSADDVDLVLTAHTLLRELEVNWPGVDIILRLRRELAVARRRLSELQR